MVDVSAKLETRRTAKAHAFVRIGAPALEKLPENPKGNPLEIARIAGIAAAKDHNIVMRGRAACILHCVAS